MNRLAHKQALTERRKHRVRHTITGTASRPRLTVHISAKHISAQIINDDAKKTLVAATTVGQDPKGTMIEKAAWAGAEIAKKAKAAKIKQVVLDRGPKLYHGRVAAFADAARANGLEF